ncbi:MAG: thioredoxin [Calditrichaeota bacterium]|nr:MAG: thioredoxin [Calditrichota bacterium]
MRRGVKLLLVVAGLFLLACSGSRKALVQENPPVMVNGEPMILGPTSYDNIVQHFPRWQVADRRAVPDSADVARLKAIRTDYEIYCFLGTWCSDSRAGVPPFVHALKQAANPHLRFHLIGVDRKKHDPQQLAARYQVKRVPTFVILKNGQEVGRMVEFPRTTFVRDFLIMVQKNR